MIASGPREGKDKALTNFDGKLTAFTVCIKKNAYGINKVTKKNFPHRFDTIKDNLFCYK